MSDDPDDVQRRPDQVVNERTHETFDDLDPHLLCKLSLLPRWTRELAERLELALPDRLRHFMDHLGRTGLVDSGLDDGSPPFGGSPQQLFWVRERCRRDVGDHVRTRLGAAVEDEYVALCGRVAKHQPDQLGLRLWLEVKGYHGDPSGRQLMERIEVLLRRGEVADAQKTVATAEVVGDVLGGSLDMSVKRAQWRLDRQYRDTDDLRHLRTYFRRRDVELALRNLVTSADDEATWALHLRGDAGVGKTMVLRYLGSSRFADDHDLKSFPVARVDFDHLNPRYPEQRPMELLIVLSDQLLRFAPSRATERYYQEVRRISDDLATAIAEPEGLNDRRRAELLNTGVRQFANLAEAMNAPVVLVLDTCEEIGKLYAPGVDAPAIDRTFDLLEQLHEAAPCVRVVFAGRRPLVPSSDDARSGPNLKERPYLAVTSILGFTEQEAREFLAERGVPDYLTDVVLRRTAVGRTGWHIPFDLEGYSAWARDDPNLTETDLLVSAGDPYVERRIVARIRDEAVLKALPVAVAYGRFDRALITPALDRLGIDAAAAFDGLVGQEWITTLAWANNHPSVLQVNEHLRERLRSVLEPHSPVLSELEQLGRDAAAVLSANRLERVAAETVEAAMGLLPVAEAAHVWRDVDRRVMAEREWSWVRHVADRVCDLDPNHTGESVLAAVRATQACAVTHSAEQGGVSNLWDEVLRHAGRHPDREQQTTLALRATLGRIAAGGHILPPGEASVVTEDVTSEAYFVDLVTEALDHQLSDSVLAAVDTILAARGPTAAAFVDAPLTALLHDPHPLVAAHAHVSQCALELARGRANGDRLAEAIRLVAVVGQPPPLPDWVPPPGLRHRARMLPLLSALRGGAPVSADLYREWRDDALRDRDDNVDADRLLAAVTDYELAHTARATTTHLRPSAVDGKVVPWLHFGLGRPFAMAVADALTAADEPDEAAAVLVGLRDAVGARSGGDPQDGTTVNSTLFHFCELALLRLCRRYRTTRYGRDVLVLTHDSRSQRVRDEALLVLRLTQGSLPERRGSGDGSAYGYWRCFPDRTPPEAPEWPVDHVDEWELAALSGRSLSHGIPDGERAQGLVALMAGEIHHLRSPERGAELFRTARSAFLAVGDDILAHHADRLITNAGNQDVARPTGRVARSEHPTVRDDVRVSSGFAKGYDLQRLVRPLSTLVLGMGVVAVFFWINSPVVRVLAVLVVLATIVPILIPLRSQRFGLGSVVTVRQIRRGRIELGTAATTMSLWPRWEQAGFLARLTHAPTRVYEITPVAPKLVEGHRLSTSLSISRSVLEPRGTRYPVGLDVTEGLLYHEWERWIGQARFRRTFVFRLVPGTRHPMRPDQWRDRKSVFAGPAELRPADADFASATERRLLYLIGIPVRTPRGIRFAVHDGFGRYTDNADDEDRTLADVGRLSATPTSVVVVQAPPLEDGPVPLGTAHNDYLRCATAATDSGVDTVLVIPPLPDRLAEAVVRRIWREVARSSSEPSTAGLFALVAEVRAMVAAAERAGSARLRANLDIIFFHRPSS